MGMVHAAVGSSVCTRNKLAVFRHKKGTALKCGAFFKMVDPSRFELLTSSMPLRRSTN